jgi:Spy/CpxP family protein refolding chaperone
MKTHLAGLFALAFLIGAARADAQNPPPAAPAASPSYGPLLTALLKGIALAPAQRLKVDSILTNFRNQAPTLTPGMEPDSVMLQRFRVLTAQALDGARTVLTPDQRLVWDRNLQEARAASMRVGP